MVIFDLPRYLTKSEAASLYEEAKRITQAGACLVPVKLVTGEQSVAVCATSHAGIAPIFIVATPKLVIGIPGASDTKKMLVSSDHFSHGEIN
jgi:hypothetical protein